MIKKINISPSSKYLVYLFLCILYLQPIQTLSQERLPDMDIKPAPETAVIPPGPVFSPPVARQIVESAPVIYSHSRDAGPDKSLFITGEGLTKDVVILGPAVQRQGGGKIQHKVQVSDSRNLIVTVDQLEPDGLYLLWSGNESGYSRPVRVNAPEVWWSAPKYKHPGDTLRIFGRNLARRPDMHQAFVYLQQGEQLGSWLEVLEASKYELKVKLPVSVQSGSHKLFVHAGTGGAYGWSAPLKLNVEMDKQVTAETKELIELEAGAGQQAIQAALDKAQTVKLGKGIFHIGTGLNIPENTALVGAGRTKTILQLEHDPEVKKAEKEGSGWGEAISRLVGPAFLGYNIEAPEKGSYNLWYRYRYTNPESKNTEQPKHLITIIHDNDSAFHTPTPDYSEDWQWAKGEPVPLDKGWNNLRFNLDNKGEVLIDAYVFTLEKRWKPEQGPVDPSDERIIVQGEDVIHMHSWKGRMPGRSYAGVQLTGNNASLTNLSVLGSPLFTVGVVIANDSGLPWLQKAKVKNVRIADIGGRQMNNCGILIDRSEAVVIEGCDITGRNPIRLKGLRNSRISGNRLASVTRFGGNGEGYIGSRTSILHQNIIENNVFYSPYRGAGYTGRRMIWASTGVGSVDNNIFRGNRVERTHFGGVAGTIQNVGEMFLFEWSSQTAYYGNPLSAGNSTVTLPEEGPYWPEEEGSREELPRNFLYDGNAFLGQFYVTVVKGRGQGQTRRVQGRSGTTLQLDSPWKVKPDNNSRIVMNPMFVRNIVIDNEITDGMSGIQFWYGSMENIIANNIIKRQRRQGIYIFASMTTAATQVPRLYNSGIGPCYYNFIEGNETDECADGIELRANQRIFTHVPPSGISIEPEPGPMDFPLLLGNVTRQNSCIRNRGDGIVTTTIRGDKVPGEKVPSAVGNIVEFNFLRNSWENGIRIDEQTKISTIRRNHIYFWYDKADEDLPVGINAKGAQRIHIDNNNVENKNGRELRTPNRLVK